MGGFVMEKKKIKKSFVPFFESTCAYLKWVEDHRERFKILPEHLRYFSKDKGAIIQVAAS